MTGSHPTEAHRCASPDLSICIVSFRCRDEVLGALEAIGQGDVGPSTTFETIVVDNDSNDGTVEEIRRRFPSVRLVALDRNHGFAHAANRALRDASGRNLLLLNPDVRVTGDTLLRAVSVLDEHPTIGALGIRLRYPDGRIQGTCGHFPDTFAVIARSLGIHGLLARLPMLRSRENLAYFCFPSERHEVDGVLGAFLMMRRNTLERVGPLDAGYFLYGEDLDWCRRARRVGVRLVYEPALEGVHAQGSSAARVPVASLRHFHRSALRYFDAHERPGLPAWVALLARASLAVRYWLALGRHALGLGHAQRIYLVLRRPNEHGSAEPIAARAR
ncbi:MAG: glycosyltransferase family 2 protein [Deltaproteobacteria bacterium]|nr:glycosyltransferase family 2 protein [Deltaproteobacteria bacterium]